MPSRSGSWRTELPSSLQCHAVPLPTNSRPNRGSNGRGPKAETSSNFVHLSRRPQPAPPSAESLRSSIRSPRGATESFGLQYYLVPLSGLPALREVYLQYLGHLTDFAPLGTLPSLRKLVVEGSAGARSGVSIASLRPLDHALNLEELVLEYASVEDGSLAPLEGLPKLRRVDLPASLADRAAAFRRARPDVQLVVAQADHRPPFVALGVVDITYPVLPDRRWTIFQIIDFYVAGSDWRAFDRRRPRRWFRGGTYPDTIEYRENDGGWRARIARRRQWLPAAELPPRPWDGDKWIVDLVYPETAVRVGKGNHDVLDADRDRIAGRIQKLAEELGRLYLIRSGVPDPDPRSTAASDEEYDAYPFPIPRLSRPFSRTT